MSTFSTQRASSACAIAIAAICITFSTVARADDMDKIGAQMRKVTEDAKAKQAAQSGQPGAKSYSIQSTSNVDAELKTFISTLNAGLACASSNSAFQQQNAALIEKVKAVLGYGQQFQSNALLRAAGAVPLAALLQAGIPVAKTFVSGCQNFGGGITAGSVQNAGPTKYDKVSAMMKEVFTGGDLSPNSRAVKHAADVDMPARGGNPEALKAYLNSQNGTVKNWYKTNFGVQ